MCSLKVGVMLLDVCEREREREGESSFKSNMCASVYITQDNSVGTGERRSKDATSETLAHQYATRLISFFQSEDNNMSSKECEDSNAFHYT